MEEDRILGVLREAPERTWTLPELLNRAGLSGKDSKEGKRVVKTLVRRGAIERERGRKYRLSRAGRRVEGYIQSDHRGVLYVVVAGKSGAPLAVHSDDLDRVRTGDRVKAEVVLEGRKSRHVAKILEAAPEAPPLRMGVLRRTPSASYVELDTPLEQLSPRGRPKKIYDLIVRPDERLQAPERSDQRPGGPASADPGAEDLRAANGQLVQVEVQYRWRSGERVPLGRVVEVIGQPGERPTELRKILIENGLTRPFPDAVEAEAKAFGTAPKEADYQGREDLRNLPLVTIDGETAKDFDDAVCAVAAGNGRYRLYVAIADVSHYVRPESPLDLEAFERGTSTYLTDRAIPMLPEALSNGLCSLNPKVDRLCMVAEITLDGQANVHESRFYPAVMRSQARLTYTQVAAALAGRPDEVTEPRLTDLERLAEVSKQLLRRRLKRGAIDLDLPEAEIVFDESGAPQDAIRRPRNDAHRLIEDLMLAANESVARFFMDRDLPTIYRVHEPPDATKLASFAAVCRTLGIRARLSDNPKPAEISKLLADLSEHPSGNTLHPLLLRSMSQARYDPEPKGHFGLAAEAYLHFTSPIRRYPDLVVHRLLKQVLAGERILDEEDDDGHGIGELALIAQQSSDRERRAMVAERQSLDLDRTLLARARLGEVLSGRVTGVQGFGLFVALDEPFIEGLIPVQTLPEDFYEVDEAGVRLIGQQTGRSFSLGDEVTIRIVAAHIGRRQVEFGLCDEDERDAPGQPGRPGHGRAPVSTARRPPPPRSRSSAPTTEEEGPRRPFNANLRLRQLREERARAEGDTPPGRGRASGRGRGRKASGRKRPRRPR